MSLSDDKRNVFTTIGAYTSFMEQQQKTPRRGEIYPSINNKKDSVPFLLDVLKTIAGSEALKGLIGGMFSELIDNSETKMKTVLKKQFIQPNSDDQLPTDFSNNGIDVPVKNIDVNGKLKINPNSDSGEMLYNNNAPNFDKKAYDAILNAGTTQTYSNLDITYTETTDSFNFKPTDSNISIGQYFSDYVDNTQIINKDELLTNVMDKIYGSLSKENNRTSEQVLQELEVDKLLEQALNDDDSFTISPADYNNLLEQSKQISNGVVDQDLGCEILTTSLPFNSLKDLINNFSGSTDPFYISNIIEDTIIQSTSGDTNAEETTDENIAAIKDGFFQKIINFFTTKLLFYLTAAPQIRVLFAISSSFQNNGTVSIDTPKNDFKRFKIIILCLAKEILKIVCEFIFMLAIAYLIELLKPVIKKIIKEKVNQFVKIIKSLTPASKVLDSE